MEVKSSNHESNVESAKKFFSSVDISEVRQNLLKIEKCCDENDMQTVTDCERFLDDLINHRVNSVNAAVEFYENYSSLSDNYLSNRPIARQNENFGLDFSHTRNVNTQNASKTRFSSNKGINFNSPIIFSQPVESEKKQSDLESEKSEEQNNTADEFAKIAQADNNSSKGAEAILEADGFKLENSAPTFTQNDEDQDKESTSNDVNDSERIKRLEDKIANLESNIKKLYGLIFSLVSDDQLNEDLTNQKK